MWYFIDTGVASPQENMDWDSNFLASFKRPTVHFYEWSCPSITYGYFIDLDKFIIQEKAKKHSLAFGRRPTGGGIVFHLCDFAFSVFLPSHHPLFSTNALQNYQTINSKILEAVFLFQSQKAKPILLEDEKVDRGDERFFCMANPTKYDLLLDDKKLGGAAQRKTKRGFLHQGTLSLTLPPFDLLQQVLKFPEVVLPKMKKNTFCLLGENALENEIIKAKKELKNCIQEVFKTSDIN